MEIRKATLKDCSACEELSNIPELLTSEGETISQGYLKDHIGTDSIFLVAEDDGVVGFILGEMLKGHVVLIHFLTVHKSVRDKGIGTKLIQALTDRCRDHKMKFLFLYAPMMNPATLKFYKKCDFTEGKPHMAFSLKLK